MSTVAVDFDGVLAEYHGFALAAPLPGAIDFLWRLHRASHQIVVFTLRAEKQEAEVVRWLREYHAPSKIKVTNVKPAAAVYIDDRAHRFDGDWDAAFSAIEAKPHWQREPVAPPLRKLPT